MEGVMKSVTVTVLCLILAILLTVAGVSQKQPSDVKRKAANICLECVGIG